jgi:hypothetical protein
VVVVFVILGLAGFVVERRLRRGNSTDTEPEPDLLKVGR